MAAFLKGLILLPVAIVVILLAVANRRSVVVSLDPFSQPDELQLFFEMPLYALLFVTAALGVVIGGIGSWLAQGRVRRERRQARREAQALRGEAERMRSSTGASRLPALPRPSRA